MLWRASATAGVQCIWMHGCMACSPADHISNGLLFPQGWTVSRFVWWMMTGTASLRSTRIHSLKVKCLGSVPLCFSLLRSARVALDHEQVQIPNKRRRRLNIHSLSSSEKPFVSFYLRNLKLGYWFNLFQIFKPFNFQFSFKFFFCENTFHYLFTF